MVWFMVFNATFNNISVIMDWRSEEQAKKVPKIFPTNEIARNKICSADLLNGHEWMKVGCVVENKLEFRQ
jgi:hypothetical protein